MPIKTTFLTKISTDFSTKIKMETKLALTEWKSFFQLPWV